MLFPLRQIFSSTKTLKFSLFFSVFLFRKCKVSCFLLAKKHCSWSHLGLTAIVNPMFLLLWLQGASSYPSEVHTWLCMYHIFCTSLTIPCSCSLHSVLLFKLSPSCLPRLMSISSVNCLGSLFCDGLWYKLCWHSLLFILFYYYYFYITQCEHWSSLTNNVFENI